MQAGDTWNQKFAIIGLTLMANRRQVGQERESPADGRQPGTPEERQAVLRYAQSGRAF